MHSFNFAVLALVCMIARAVTMHRRVFHPIRDAAKVVKVKTCCSTDTVDKELMPSAMTVLSCILMVIIYWLPRI